MKTLPEIREALMGIAAAATQIVKGCEDAQHQEVSEQEIDYLVMACAELHKTAEIIRGKEAPSDPFIPSPREELIGDLRAYGYDASFHARSGQVRVFLNGHWFKVAGGTAPHPTLIEVPATEL